jgi:hypothetical protein
MKRLVLGPIITIGLLVSATTAAPTLRTVSLSGQPAPGANGGTFATFLGPEMNSSGHTSFSATLSNGGSVNAGNNSGLWSEGHGTLGLVAREGFQAPGTASGAHFYDLNFGPPRLNDAGNIAFAAGLQTGSGGVSFDNAGGVWVERAGALTLVARAGDQPPSATALTRFQGFQAVSLNSTDRVAFQALLCTGPCSVSVSESANYSDGGGPVALVARRYDQAVGYPVGEQYTYISAPQFDDAGQTAYLGEVSNEPNHGLWAERNGNLNLIVREADQAPGAPDGQTFRIFHYFDTNDSGEIAFSVDLISFGIGVGSGVWAERGGALTKIARTGDPVQGLGPDINYVSFLTQPVINNAGQVAVLANIDTPLDNSVIVSDGSGTLTIIAREGSQAPGTPDGSVFEAFNSLVTINDAGKMAFQTRLRAGLGGVTDSNDWGIWAQNLIGELQLVVREGDALQVGPGDSRIVSELSFYNAFNDRGQLAFWASFTDGSQGIFVTAVPEPSALILACLCAQMLPARLKRRGV